MHIFNYTLLNQKKIFLYSFNTIQIRNLIYKLMLKIKKEHFLAPFY